jgi:alpha-L-fucosidase 2
MMALYFQYGRYLLLGSSRAPGRLPANLQGIWNEHYIAPWNSDYHTNINLQMNYWPAHVGNLSETAEPLHNFIDQYRVPGRVTAQKMYNASGWTMHHATDIFGKTGIVDGIESGTSPLAAAWLCTHLWEHYLFTQDKAFLRTTGYPVIKEAVRFIQSFLIEDSAGQLVTAPSMSPENSFKLRDGTASITYAPSIDVQTIIALYDACLQAGAIVGESKAFADSLRQTLKKLPPVQVSKRYGIVQEWIQDYEEAEPGHRHMSQLIGLYPFNIINPTTPVCLKRQKKPLNGGCSSVAATPAGAGPGSSIFMHGCWKVKKHMRIWWPCCKNQPCQTSSITTRRFRSMAILAQRQALRKCCCNRKAARSYCCLRCPKLGRKVL